MIVIGLRFPAGRFHATPWDRHVNEGIPEWPPSPWRLLRSLVAVWKTKAPELEEDHVRAILEQLAPPPVFHLPAASAGHSRHYMRWYKKGPEDQTLVFDAFVSVERTSEIEVVWPDGELDTEQRGVLYALLRNLSYLGRAESWCEARLLDEIDKERSAWPLDGQAPGPGQELVRVLCPDPEKALGSEHVTETKTTGRGKNKETIETSRYDPAWNLCMDTEQLHKEKWSDPPGSQWVTYVRPSDCLDPPPKRRPPLIVTKPRMQVVRFALDSTVLPLVTETLPLAEGARCALMGLYKRMKLNEHYDGDVPEPLPPDAPTPKSEAFSGKNANGDPLQGHTHAFFLPTDEDKDGRLDHLTVVASRGFDRPEIRACDRLFEIKSRERDKSGHRLNLLLLGMGMLDEYQPGPLAASRVWVSATPYVASRYAKTRGRERIDIRSPEAVVEFLCSDLRRQIKNMFADTDKRIGDVEIEPLLDGATFRLPGGRRPIQFKRFRSRKPSDDGGRRLAGAFRITFPQDVTGPVALGHSSHFGLGLFVPEKE